jgi:hypothetical protein
MGSDAGTAEEDLDSLGPERREVISHPRRDQRGRETVLAGGDCHRQQRVDDPLGIRNWNQEVSSANCPCSRC